MNLISTNGKAPPTTWSDGVLQGLAPDGGLYIPATVPRLSPDELTHLRSLSFPEVCAHLAHLFLSDEVSRETLEALCKDAFNFPLTTTSVQENIAVLELFHGPTCAFKDFGARFMARLFRHFLGRSGDRLTVLAATSGDTGSAVANAFFDRTPNAPIQVFVLFPKGKVSEVQEKQMTTLGGNVRAFEVDGTFDDCQRLVKTAFTDTALTSRSKLTSANSINIARLLPQLFYYAYTSLHADAPPVFVVPSGNLGNVTGGILAHRMGLPIQHFLAACNSNDIFPQYLESEIFAPRPSVETVSNAMDVGNPSNFVRILALFERSHAAIRELVSSAAVTDEETISTMRAIYENRGYILDPHTAVGYAAAQRRPDALDSNNPIYILATAHPAKFGEVVKRAIGKYPEMPQQLKEVLEKPSEKISLSSRYEDLAQYL